MDLDEIMSKVYARAAKEDRIDEALSCYVDVLNQYGKNPLRNKQPMRFLVRFSQRYKNYAMSQNILRLLLKEESLTYNFLFLL